MDPSEGRCGTSPPMATVPGLPWAGERVPERTLAQGGGAGPQRGPASVRSLPVPPGGCAWSPGGSSEVAPWRGVRSPAQRPLGHFRFRSARPRQNRRCRGGRSGWSSGSACRAQRRHHSGRVDVRLGGMSAQRGRSARPSQGWGWARQTSTPVRRALAVTPRSEPRPAARCRHVRRCVLIYSHTCAGEWRWPGVRPVPGLRPCCPLGGWRPLGLRHGVLLKSSFLKAGHIALI